MTLHHNVVGVDVARDWIDICDLASGAVRHIETTPQALKAFAAQCAGSLVVFEASGGCERPLVEALEVAKVAYARVNPRQAREFARATGKLAKTDKVDARVLANMGASLKLAPTPPADPARVRLAELVGRRENVVTMISQETQRLATARDAFVRRDIKSHLTVLARRRMALETEIKAQTASDETLAGTNRRMRTAPGIGPAIAGTLLACLPELGSIDRRAIASLAGLAPHACDSGHSKGRRQVWGGRPAVRRALYIAAFIASRCDPDLKAMRQRLQTAGKPFKVAIIAVARKLLTILNAMIREDRDYQKTRPA